MGRKVTIYLNGALEYTVSMVDGLEIVVAAKGPAGSDHNGPQFTVSESAPPKVTRVERPETPDPRPPYDAEEDIDPSERA